MKKILLVDDDKDFLDIFVRKFTQEGFLVQVAENGETGLEILKKENFDLLVIDVNMPKMDGLTFYYEVSTKLKKNIPTVILTTVKSTSYQDDIKEYIVKSETSLEELVKKIKKHLGNGQAD